jgi:serine/threonine protein kinase/WD40 repeat protein
MDSPPDINPSSGAQDSPHNASTLGEVRTRMHPEQVVARRYEIVKRVGRGGMGEVWHAYDVKLRVDVALKSVRRSTTEAIEALRQEVRTAREVISPNVCRIFDLVEEAREEFISMEYIDGVTLLALLQERSPLELGQASEIALQFLAGLEAIHHAGLIHRDLKPENIMITRAGRVVVMDFGIAKRLEQVSGTISGTPPYMSPEQLSGQVLDARADVFSAGVLLAEMITEIRDRKSRENTWAAVREIPPKLIESPWQPVITRAVARDRYDRFPSAGALARALEEVTQRVETIEERKPYPGLSSFTEADTKYFFGRELEAETVLKKLEELHLFAIIGPSGAGKTSFLRAGLIPSLSKNFSHAFTVPGDSPLTNLSQALAAEFSGDTEAIRRMVRLDDIDSALWLLVRWRQKHPEALLIVDRFEELFTLNKPEIQSRFTELLGRALLEADVRVLLTMRDDFLIFCKEYPSLSPIFSDLTALLPLNGPSLRRALVQPALQCGYRFEDEALVDEILDDVERERGALPLMAFAAARLWEKRDRKEGLLTRAAYQQIGGVGGALARHAETSMERIGLDRQPIVREIFRNLMTAQNTRAARDIEEILSIFENREAAQQVLRTLIDSRLLSSFEAPAQEGEKPRRRVEIIHESLLSAWPRLVRWQTQDADSAQLRDQIRQGAQLWEQRGRTSDLLWTGTAYLEFQAWRQRYSGGLTSTEQAFTDAMAHHATRQRRKRRIVISIIFIILLSVLALISTFWRGAEISRKQAVSEAQRAEAGKLLALGRGELDADPSRAIAYSLASMEVADTPEARRFALQALWKGPTAMITALPIGPPLSYVEFSPDGNWLAVGGGADSGIRVLNRNGGSPLVFGESQEMIRMRMPQFSPDSRMLIWRSGNDQMAEVWMLSPQKKIRSFRLAGETICIVRAHRVLFITDLTNHPGEFMKWTKTLVQSWNFVDQELKTLGHWNFHTNGVWTIDSTGEFFILSEGNRLYTKLLDHIETSPKVFIGEHSSGITTIADNSGPARDMIAAADSSNEIRIWSAKSGSEKPLYTFSEKEPIGAMVFNPSRFVVAIMDQKQKTIRLRNISAPPEAEEQVLLPVASDFITGIAFHPTEPLLAIAHRDNLFLYFLNHSYPYIFRTEGMGGTNNVDFLPNGKSVVTSLTFEDIQLWPVPGKDQSPVRNIWKIAGEGYIQKLDMDPLGRYLLASTLSRGTFLISISDGKAESLPGRLLKVGPGYGPVSFAFDGRTAAGAVTNGPDEYLGIQIWDLNSKTVRVLEKSKGTKFYSLKFSSDGSLFSGDAKGNLWQWDLSKNTFRIFAKGNSAVHGIALTKDRGFLVACFLPADRWGDMLKATSEVILYDVKNTTSRKITSHGNRIYSVAFDPTGTMLVTGDLDGIVRVGPTSGESPHLLYGHQNWITKTAVSSDGRWIGSTENTNPVLRLWPMPHGEPFQALPYEELLNRLRRLTNIRVVKDSNSVTGYNISYALLPGWKNLPTW